MIYLKLFISFLQVGLFSIGGGYAAIPLIKTQCVDLNEWLSLSEFSDLVTIAEMTPGPIAVNSATFVGLRIAGLFGAVAATVGCIVPSLIIVSILAYVYTKYKKMQGIKDALSGLRPAVVALILSAGVTILFGAVFGSSSINFANTDIINLIIFAAAFFVLRKFKISPILVMCLSGGIYLVASLITDAL